MDELWLPEGHHWDLHIEHDPLPDAGAFTGGGWKLVLHTVESPWSWVDGAMSVLSAKNAAPHFVIGGKSGREHPTVVQTIPLNLAGRALRNDSGDGYQTNRANAIQVEICGYASESQTWPVERIKALANLFGLIRHRVNVPCAAPQDFSKPRRMSDAEWVKASGIVGHSMAPDNDH